MARKNTHSHKMINATSMGATITSAATSVKNMDKAGILVEWSAGSTPVGVITVQARFSPTGNYVDLDFGSAINVSGNSGSHQIRLDELPFQDIRVVYTRTSGSGTLNVTVVIKQVGG